MKVPPLFFAPVFFPAGPAFTIQAQGAYGADRLKPPCRTLSGITYLSPNDNGGNSKFTLMIRRSETK
jgi:hypothetical protein